MNLNDWIYHLSLRTTLYENGFLDPCAPVRRRRERIVVERARRVAIAGVALLAPALLVAAALLGG